MNTSSRPSEEGATAGLPVSCPPSEVTESQDIPGVEGTVMFFPSCLCPRNCDQGSHFLGLFSCLW